MEQGCLQPERDQDVGHFALYERRRASTCALWDAFLGRGNARSTTWVLAAPCPHFWLAPSAAHTGRAPLRLKVGLAAQDPILTKFPFSPAFPSSSLQTYPPPPFATPRAKQARSKGKQVNPFILHPQSIEKRSFCSFPVGIYETTTRATIKG
ncbi:hypothetical protein VTH06DRAFT_8606 [Thermothelomyces fergusii]